LYYNPLEQFCASNGSVQFLCGGKQFDYPRQQCIEDKITGQCGAVPLLDYETNFCYEEISYPLCNGKDYNPTSQFCHGTTTILDKCGGTVEYNPATHYCHTDGETYSCGNKPYNPSIQGCCTNNIYDLKKMHYGREKDQFCDERDGKAYVKVIIGNGATAQTWMAENLNYNASGSWCYGDNTGGDSQNRCDTYGRLYTWTTAMAGATSSSANPSGRRGVCPVGWHIPSQAEWNTLMKFVNPSCADASTSSRSICADAGTKLKAASGWNNHGSSSGNGTDDYGFSALPSGFYSSNFFNVGLNDLWWSATEFSASIAYRRIVGYDVAYVDSYYYEKSNLYSVRCVQDN